MLGASIEFVREYLCRDDGYYDVVYSSGEARTFRKEDLPGTVKGFINQAVFKRDTYNPTRDRPETIYSIGR